MVKQNVEETKQRESAEPQRENILAALQVRHLVSQFLNRHIIGRAT